MADKVFGMIKESVTSVADTTGAIAKQKVLQRLMASGIVESEQIRDSLQIGIVHFLSSDFENRPEEIVREKFTAKLDGKGENSDFEIEAFGLGKFSGLFAAYGIEPKAICERIGKGKFREVSNPASSGSLLFLSGDSTFLIKTLRDYDAKFIQQKFVDEYFSYVVSTEATFLVKLFGSFSFVPYLSQHVHISVDSMAQRFAIYSNCIPTHLEIHEKYDLKGSSYRRDANVLEKQKSSATLKDNDFRLIHPEGLTLQSDVFDFLYRVFQRDVKFLEELKIMDYSLLLTIHNLDNRETPKSFGAIEALCGGFKDPLLIGMGSDYMNKESDQQKQPKNKLVLKFDRPCRTTKFGFKDPTIFSLSNLREFGGIPAVNEKGERVLLFLGIIDILQTFDAAKVMQNKYQTVENPNVCRERSIVEPVFYAKRFLEFIFGSVFLRGGKSLDEHPVIMMVPAQVQQKDSSFDDENSVRF